MELTSFFPICKKRRRSNRLLVKKVYEKKVAAISTNPLGYFDTLPVELKFHVFGYVSIEDLSLLAITSKALRNVVECYRVTSPCERGLTANCRLHGPMGFDVQAQNLSHYHKLGLLMKRSTCLYSTKDRLKIITDFLTRMMCRNTASCRDRTKCIAELCFGKFLHAIIAGWDDSECQRTFDAICQNTCMLKHITIVINSKPGYHRTLEYEVRCFLRRVFLDACVGPAATVFWLSRILKPWPIIQQARLLFLLYGATHQGTLQWDLMCFAPVDVHDSDKCFGSIGCALSTIHLYSTEWSGDALIGILNEMTGCPEEWIGENKAALLLYCGEPLTLQLLTSNAINGSLAELASIISSFCLVSARHRYNLNFVLRYLQPVLQTMESSRDRISFIDILIDMFKEHVLDLYDYSNADEDGDQRDLMYVVTAFSEFSKLVAQMAFKHVLKPEY